jgi:hypothetical protein
MAIGGGFFGNQRVPNPAPGSQTGFNTYAAGRKHYGGGRLQPNLGPVSGAGMLGYANRDQQAKARKDAIMRRLQAQQTGNPMNPNILGVNS